MSGKNCPPTEVQVSSRPQYLALLQSGIGSSYGLATGTAALPGIARSGNYVRT